MLVSGVDIVEQQVEAQHPLVDVGGGEIHGVVMVEERAQGLPRVTNAVLELVEAGVDVAVVVVKEFARRDQCRAELGGAVEVARETVAFRRSVSVVQVRRDFR
ncbi:hypothetical protein D9M70_577040 [compost metagenome]